jgi:hypothetical protein
MLTIDGQCDPRFANQYVTGTATHPDRRVLSRVDAVYAARR